MDSKNEADRRREPRFGAEGEVVLLANEGAHEKEIRARLMDFSLHGLRVRIPHDLPEGQQVRVFFSWGEVDTQVVRTCAAGSGYDIGLQLF